jgi:hypothetical protein
MTQITVIGIIIVLFGIVYLISEDNKIKVDMFSEGKFLRTLTLKHKPSINDAIIIRNEKKYYRITNISHDIDENQLCISVKDISNLIKSELEKA